MATALVNQQLSEYFELREFWKLDPAMYCRQRLGLNPTWQQSKILEAIAPKGSKVTVRSGHGIGKDGVAAGIIWWFIECHDYSRCACTAPSAHQLRDILWGELAKWKRRADALSRYRGDIPEIWLDNMFKLNQDTLHDVGAPLEWYAIARTARKENPEALQGLHASDMDIDGSGTRALSLSDASLLFVLDEASGIPDEIFEVAEGALSSPDSRVLMIGNPTRNIGRFAASHKAHRGEYKTFHFRSQDSPLCDPDYRPGLVRKFGEGSNVVRVRADGEFPSQDDDTLIALEDAEAALSREWDISERQPTGLKRLGVDPARYGNDRTAFVCRHDFLVSFIAVRTKQDTMTTAGQAIAFAESLQVDDIAVDIIGLGSGVYDRVAEIMQERKVKREWYCTVTAVNVAQEAPPKGESDDAQAAKLRDYLWLEVRKWLKESMPCITSRDRENASALVGELATPKFKLDSSGRVVVESKDDMKKRLNGSSPDLGDALGCTFSPPKKEIPLIAPFAPTQTSRWTF